MNRQALEKICAQVYQKFPEVAGSAPKVQPYGESQHLLIFQGKGTTASGHAIQRMVRVVATQDGKVVKITTSR